MDSSTGNRVIVTGAAGNLGSKLSHHLSTHGWQVELLDIVAADNILRVDLSQYTADWVGRFAGAEAVIHLAGASWPYNDWQLLQRGNIDAVLNVLEASVAGGVSRFIFASSLLTMDGYKNTAGMIHPNMAGRPLSFYAVCKLAGERMCYNYAARHGMEVACLRLGITRRGPNDPTNRVDLWEQCRWLGNNDMCRAIELALRKPGGHEPYTVFVVSNNVGMRWSLDETRQQLGYIPQQSSIPSPPPFRNRWPLAAAKQLARRLSMHRIQF